jgi:lipopolysaccharide transport system permease protein
MVNNSDKEIIIQPISSKIFIDFSELWRSRELLFMLAWRDIKIRYKQTVIGVAWVIFQPLMNMVIFSFFFGKVAKIPSDNLPYPLFVLCGLVFWTFFSNALTNSSSSLIINEDVIKKVYFPKVIAPLSAIIPSLLDLGINLTLLIPFLIYFQRTPSLSSITIIPICIAISIITVCAIGILLSAINVKYRDVRYILPFFIQLLLFTTPVIYPTSMLKKEHVYIVALNPMTGVIHAFRTVIAGSTHIDYMLLGIGLGSSIILLTLALFYFSKTERYFADSI